VRPRPIPDAGEGGPNEDLGLTGRVHGRMDHPTCPAAAAQDDAVGVAVNSVQQLGVPDHGGTFSPTPGGRQEVLPRASGRPGGLELTPGTTGGTHLEQLDLRTPRGIHPREPVAHGAHLGDDGLTVTAQPTETGKGEERPADPSLVLHIVSLSARTVPYQSLSGRSHSPKKAGYSRTRTSRIASPR
jgi:hypothetical protein